MANNNDGLKALAKAQKKQTKAQMWQPLIEWAVSGLPKITNDSYKKGGKVKQTGMALVHKGERVLTKKQAAKPAVKRAIKKKK